MDEALQACLTRARLIWAGCAGSGPIYSVVALILAVASQEGVLSWPGLSGEELPFGEWVLLIAFALLTPVFVAAVRAVATKVQAHLLRRAAAQGEPLAARFGAWTQAQMVAWMVAELPVVGALVLALVFGTLLTLWVTSALHVVMMISYMPTRWDFEQTFAE